MKVSIKSPDARFTAYDTKHGDLWTRKNPVLTDRACITAWEMKNPVYRIGNKPDKPVWLTIIKEGKRSFILMKTTRNSVYPVGEIFEQVSSDDNVIILGTIQIEED